VLHLLVHTSTQRWTASALCPHDKDCPGQIRTRATHNETFLALGRVAARPFVLVNIMRPDKEGPHRSQFEKNRKRIFATQTVCALCGKPVDFSLKAPHPLSATVDHIIPVAKGGHPSDLANLQLAHRCCNRAKSDKLASPKEAGGQQVISNRVLPATFDWCAHPPRELKAI
jgi:5-methylcytosine-specific restriction endonuclease McrA